MVTWDELTDLERADLRFLVKSGAGAIYKPRQVRLTALGLIAGDGLFSTPTDAGRALVASVDAGAGDDDTIATLRQQAITDAGIIDKLSTQVVHAQMLLQTALGYEEVDYHISLTDLEADILALRQQLADARAALEQVVNYQLPTKKQTNYSDVMMSILQIEYDNVRRIAAKALQAVESGEGE